MESTRGHELPTVGDQLLDTRHDVIGAKSGPIEPQRTRSVHLALVLCGHCKQRLSNILRGIPSKTWTHLSGFSCPPCHLC